MSPPRTRIIALVLVLLACAAGLAKAFARTAPAPSFVVHAPAFSNAPPRMESGFVSVEPNVRAHAASLVELGDGRIRVFRWQGSGEGAQDVDVRTAVLDPATGRWQDERVVVTPTRVQQGLGRYVRKIGNAVAGRAADGTLRLFFVTVSIGGWAGSSISMMTSQDDGVRWGPARRLVTSPFLNLSTLVRGAAFLHTDDTMTVPVYHEFIGKFGELVRLDAAGRVIDKQRLTGGDRALQPVVLIRSPTEALVLLRNGSYERPRHVIQVSTTEAGARWTPPNRSALANPHAPLTGVVLPDGRLAVALNNLEACRTALSLVLSADGGATWQDVYRFEDEGYAGGVHPDPVRFRQTVAALARAADATVGDTAVVVGSSSRSNNLWD